MRREEKQITSRSEIDTIIRTCTYCHLAFAEGARPYVVPVCFGYDGRFVYFHTAETGKKVDIMEKNSAVCFSMERNVSLITDPGSPCKWSFAFESVVGDGHVEELNNEAVKSEGLNLIVSHYASGNLPALPPSLGSLRVWRIHIDRVTGKRSHI